ncbi:ADP-ribose pyrophosphatase YjhB (NUDIX family) [Jatrophihabitans sp. GAS493]|uniref:NUDIX hydrolase n=1 Tax=Jatrophihabitans sp. GAS493 TaxID=1907575 RepID=UPI000BB80902|nr:NUDIX domain-containing protein [Jatrophihabitans sp. GAS493]SOD73159.1 ADP-ribose pyrophosphatase YjhB (NUDIX family) [Jatrophihabitans sp. GAS493]
MTTTRIRAAGGVVFDDRRRLLMVERARDPWASTWSIPGGKCDGGETSDAACVRELAEETGLAVRVLQLLGSVEDHVDAVGDAAKSVTYCIDDYLCSVVGGTLHAADDATQARWVSRAELAQLPLVPGLLSALTEWGALPD